MALEYLHGRWHFHQRMNKKVWTNIEKLKRTSAQAQSKQDILDALHPWRLSISLRFNNTFAILQFIIGACILLACMFWFPYAPLLLTLIWFASIALCIYAYCSIEKQSDIDNVIRQLSEQVFQYQYDVKFNNFPHIDTKLLNSSYMLARVRQGFNCLNQGNSANRLPFFAATTWHINGHDFPVFLFHYECINETAIRDKKGNPLRKEIKTDYYGACVFHMPIHAFMVSNIEKTYPRYPVRWSSSDIQFNQQFNIAGQQELELARTLTPQRILSLAQNLEHMRGTLMFHDEMNAFCYMSKQNIFAITPPEKEITDISMLRGHLRTLKAPHYEHMKSNLSQIIQTFKDEKYLAEMKQ